MKREIEPLLNRNRIKVAVETSKNQLNTSDTKKQIEVTPLLNIENNNDFAAGFKSREAGKSVNPPSSRGGFRNNADAIYAGILNEG